MKKLITKRFKQEGELYALLLLFFFIVIVYINIIPFYRTTFPDERVHYNANVNFLIENKRLPVAGIDDLDYVSNTRENLLGQVNAVYSYNIYPQFNYIISAIVAIFMHKIFGLPLEIGARYASLFWGLIFIFYLYKLLSLISTNRLIRTIVISTICFIPGIPYLAAYTNQDMHSLAISAILAYTLFKLLNDFNNKNMIKFGLACALLLVAKLNYLVYVPFIAGFLFWKYLFKKEYSHKSFWKMVLIVCLLALGLSGFWYIRNYMLYGDFIGQEYLLSKMSEYGELGIAQNISLSTFVFFLEQNFFGFLFDTFFMWFLHAGMLPPYLYLIMFLVLNVTLVYMIYAGINNKDKMLLKSLIALLSFTLISITLVIVNSCVYDYQPQGRYIYPILVPVACLLTYFFTTYKAGINYLLCLLTVVITMSVQSMNIAIKTYVPYQMNTREISDAIVGNSQNMFEEILGNVAGNIIEQDIIANKNNMKAIAVKIGIYNNQEQSGVVKALVIDENEDIIGSYSNELSNLEDNKDIYIPVSIENNRSKGKNYKLKIWCENITPQTTFTLYCSSAPTFGKGDLFIDNNKQGIQIYYKTLYEKK